jgi:hypothetical protein
VIFRNCVHSGQYLNATQIACPRLAFFQLPCARDLLICTFVDRHDHFRFVTLPSVVSVGLWA